MCTLLPKPWFTILYCFLFRGRGLYHISYHHDIPMIFRWYPIVYHYIIFVSLPVLIPIWVADVPEELDVAQPILQDLVRALTWVTSDRLMDFQRRVMMVTQSLLVGGLEHEFYFPIYIGNFIIHLTTVIFFRGVGQPPIWQSKRVWFPDCNAITWHILSGHNCQTQWIQWHWGPQDSWVGL